MVWHYVPRNFSAWHTPLQRIRAARQQGGAFQCVITLERGHCRTQRDLGRAPVPMPPFASTFFGAGDNVGHFPSGPWKRNRVQRERGTFKEFGLTLTFSDLATW